MKKSSHLKLTALSLEDSGSTRGHLGERPAYFRCILQIKRNGGISNAAARSGIFYLHSNSIILSIFLIGLSAILLFSIMYESVKKETYELESLQISPDTIRSIKTVEDTVKTEQDRERAALEVPPVYQFSDDVGTNRQAIAMSIFDFLIEVKKMGELEELRKVRCWTVKGK